MRSEYFHLSIVISEQVRNDILRQSSTLWDDVEPVKIDAQKLQVLFESKAKDLNNKVRTVVFVDSNCSI